VVLGGGGELRSGIDREFVVKSLICWGWVVVLVDDPIAVRFVPVVVVV
jgi:hypothetical protein